MPQISVACTSMTCVSPFDMFENGMNEKIMFYYGCMDLQKSEDGYFF